MYHPFVQIISHDKVYARGFPSPMFFHLASALAVTVFLRAMSLEK